MKLLYKPFALIASAIAARIGAGVFKALWSKVDDAKPPEPSVEHTTLPKVIGAAVLEAAIMAGVGAAVDRGSARAFQYFTGAWPGDEYPDEDDDD